MDKPIISQYLKDFLTNDKEFHGYIDFFVEIFHIEELLREYGDTRHSGHKSVDLYKYLLGLVFDDISFNRDLKRDNAPYSQSAVRRFLKNPRIDWEKFTTKLAYRVFEFLFPMYENPNAKLYFILDETPYKREYTMFADDISVQKDHSDGTYYNGYRLSALSVYYNGLVLPVNGVLVSADELEKLIYQSGEKTGTEVAKRRQKQLRGKTTEVILEQLEWAEDAGFKGAAGTIFDTWYTHPRTVQSIRRLDLEVVGAIKNAKTRFLFQGEWLRVGEIFEKLAGLNPESNEDGIFFAPVVLAQVDGSQYPMRLAFAENVNPQRDYFCIASTDLSIEPAAVVEIYRFRWSLETIFKELKKKTLSLSGSDQSLTAEAIAANVAIIFSRYLLLISSRALDGADERTVQDQFYVCREGEKAVSEINKTVKELQRLIPELANHFHLDEQKVMDFMANYLENSKDFQELFSKLPSANFRKKPKIDE